MYICNPLESDFNRCQLESGLYFAGIRSLDWAPQQTSMKNEPDVAPSGASKKPLKYKPKIPPHKLAKVTVPKLEPVEANEGTIDNALLAKLNSAKGLDVFARRGVKNERKFTAPQVAVGSGGTSRSARPYVICKGNAVEDELQEGFDTSLERIKEYVEPWDIDSYYPVTLPMRKPYSGDPETLNEVEFGETSTNLALEESNIDAASEIGLKENGQTELIFFQLPPSLPLANTSNADVKSKLGGSLMKGSSLEELPAGFIGKMLVYKSGAVKMKIGATLFDVSPGLTSIFAQDVMAINTKEKHCCVLGELNKKAVVTPDVDSLLDSINNS